MQLAAISPLQAAAYGCAAWVVFWILRVLYRISPLHPLSKIPGPTLPVMTKLYEFYQNVILDGQFVFKTVEWHEKYGPIVRISHDEVHIADASFWNTLYSKDYRFVKDGRHYLFTQQKEGGLGNTNTRTHKARRLILDPLFSTQAVTKLEPRIKKYVDLALARIGRSSISEEEISSIDEGFEINMVFRCLTVDVVSEYAYSESIGMLEAERLDDPFFEAMDNLIGLTWFYNWTSLMQDFLRALPVGFVKKIVPHDVLGVLEFQDQALARVNSFLADPEKAKAKYTHTTVMEVLMNSDNKNHIPLSVNALKEEAYGFLAAGSETTASTLTNGIYEACKQPHIQEELYKELLAAFPDPQKDPITWKKAQALPYLSGFIKESLRVPPVIPGRFPRYVPKGGITVCGQFIPEGTSIAMSQLIQMYDPHVYKDPKKFEPERWIRDKIPEQYFVAFGKGSRGCQGMNLAWAELYLTFASLFRSYRFELAKNSTLVDTWTDQFIPKRQGKLKVLIIPRV